MAQAVTTDSIQVVTFCLVNEASNKREDYAIPIEQVKEIRTLEEITKVPKTKSYVKGIMNLRGLIIPVIDVKDKLGFGTTNLSKESKQRILVAEVKDALYGLLVDDVDQVMRIPSKDIGPAPPGAFEALNYVKGIAKTSDKLIVLIDVLPLIIDEEKESKELTKTAKTEPEPIRNKIEEPNPIPTESQTTESSESEDVDDIPPELKAVFEEDENGITPTEIAREEQSEDASGFDTPEDFQSQVDKETTNQ